MTNLKKDINEIKEIVSGKKKKKGKKFKIPMSARVKNAFARKNYVTIMKINENHQIEFKKKQIEEQTFWEEEIPRLAAAGHVCYYKKNPMIILPSWSVEPFSPRESYESSMVNGSNSKGFKLLMNTMKLSTLESKKKMPNMLKWILGAGLVAIIGYALITGGA